MPYNVRRHVHICPLPGQGHDRPPGTRHRTAGSSDVSPVENTVADAVLTVAEAAVYLKVSTPTIRRWCAQGRIPCFRIGRHWRVSRSELDRLAVFTWTVSRQGEEPVPAAAAR